MNVVQLREYSGKVRQLHKCILPPTQFLRTFEEGFWHWKLPHFSIWFLTWIRDYSISWMSPSFCEGHVCTQLAMFSLWVLQNPISSCCAVHLILKFIISTQKDKLFEEWKKWRRVWMMTTANLVVLLGLPLRLHSGFYPFCILSTLYMFI